MFNCVYSKITSNQSRSQERENKKLQRAKIRRTAEQNKKKGCGEQERQIGWVDGREEKGEILDEFFLQKWEEGMRENVDCRKEKTSKKRNRGFFDYEKLRGNDTRGGRKNVIKWVRNGPEWKDKDKKEQSRIGAREDRYKQRY